MIAANPYLHFDSASASKRYIKESVTGLQEAILSVEGIACGGCVPGIENKIRGFAGISRVSINPSTRRALISWDAKQLPLSQLLSKIDDIGYQALPYEPRQQETRFNAQRRQALLRIGVAAALGMQVMMMVVALYFGEALGMEASHRYAFQVAALVMTIPVMLFCAKPFFQNAWRDLRQFSLGVDVPISIALVVAFIGSVLATLGYPGQVYYESIVMFTVLLLSARYMELVARSKGLDAVAQMQKSIPETAQRLDAYGQTKTIDSNDIQVNDAIKILPGEVIPADGRVSDGTSSVDESIITGESRAIKKTLGDRVIAGSVNIENTLTIRATHASADNAISSLLRITERAQSSKPNVARLADKIAGKFVLGVLCIAAIAGLIWWFKAPSLALGVVISTLVIACPCALSLATPTAYVAALGSLTKRGMIPIKTEFLEGLLNIDHAVFDKTGTLTMGNPSVVKVKCTAALDQDQVLAIAAALNADSRHPLARAIKTASGTKVDGAQQVVHIAGGGVSGLIDGHHYVLGAPAFVSEHLDDADQLKDWSSSNLATSHSLMATHGQIVARIDFVDQLRPGAAYLMHALQAKGITISLLSGDDESVVAATAQSLGITNYLGRLNPEQKLQQVKALQQRGRCVVAFGDGLNDAPILAAADVSIAMGKGADLAKINADVILTTNRLGDFLNMLSFAQRTRAVIQQNFAWAIGYNLLAIPAAVFGMVPPWAAVIGMSVSSLIVSVNSLRLLKMNADPSSSSISTAERFGNPAAQ